MLFSGVGETDEDPEKLLLRLPASFSHPDTEP